jgi:hypothetical protein
MGCPRFPESLTGFLFHYFSSDSKARFVPPQVVHSDEGRSTGSGAKMCARCGRTVIQEFRKVDKTWC